MSMIGGPIFILLLKGVYMKVNHLSFSYNHQSYMKDINIQFKDQKITTIIGPNGSGKSTLLMLLSRIYKIQQGSIN